MPRYVRNGCKGNKIKTKNHIRPAQKTDAVHRPGIYDKSGTPRRTSRYEELNKSS